PCSSRLFHQRHQIGYPQDVEARQGRKGCEAPHHDFRLPRNVAAETADQAPPIGQAPAAANGTRTCPPSAITMLAATARTGDAAARVYPGRTSDITFASSASPVGGALRLV